MALLILTAALALAAAPAPPRPLSADEHAALRCSAAFALVSAGQVRGDPAAAQYPPLKLRGREFFVVTAAWMMPGWMKPGSRPLPRPRWRRCAPMAPRR